jgi:predicted amidohydrolase
MMEKRPIKIATAQSQISPDPRENGAEVRRLTREARLQGASLIHFAEGALSGNAKAQIKDWAAVDWEAVADELGQTAALAAELGIWVVVGCAHRLTGPHRPHNSLYVLSPEGAGESRPEARYDKRFISHTELSKWYAPGEGACAFEIGGWRFGCALCIEIQFAEIFLEYAALDVDCVLFSAYADSPMFGIQAQGHAATHNYWFSLSIPTQLSQTLTSRLIGPDGEIQARCEPERSGLVVSELIMDDPRYEIALKRARPWRKQAREGGIYRAARVDDTRSKEKRRF